MFFFLIYVLTINVFFSCQNPNHWLDVRQSMRTEKFLKRGEWIGTSFQFFELQ